ncbi:MAG: hypothetical protein KAQ68_06035 [Clostridiales bacterium]|nr:hypothetical protein [Clostridiales bacterium]
MKRLSIFLIIIVLALSGCAVDSAPELAAEDIKTFDVIKETQEATQPTEKPQATEESVESEGVTIEEKLAKIDFYLISGFFSRNVVQEEVEYTEMFALDKTSFVRIAQNDVEQEVYAYNYISDDFTYIYYFDGEMTSKTVFNIATGAILQDPDGYTELLTIDAEELKVYFFSLLDASGIIVEELKQTQ